MVKKISRNFLSNFHPIYVKFLTFNFLSSNFVNFWYKIFINYVKFLTEEFLATIFLSVGTILAPNFLSSNFVKSLTDNFCQIFDIKFLVIYVKFLTDFWHLTLCQAILSNPLTDNFCRIFDIKFLLIYVKFCDGRIFANDFSFGWQLFVKQFFQILWQNFLSNFWQWSFLRDFWPVLLK